MIGRVSEASFPKLLWMSAGSSGACPGMFSTGKHGLTEIGQVGNFPKCVGKKYLHIDLPGQYGGV